MSEQDAEPVGGDGPVSERATNAADDLRLDSTYFVAFDMTHSALKEGLAAASDLNITQYRMLVKLLSVGEHGLAQTDLGAALSLKANVVTQALNGLEAAGFARRSPMGGRDGRIKLVSITDAGVRHIAEANAAIVERLYAVFPTENELYRSILEASIAAGARIDPPQHGEMTEKHPASRALVSLETIRKALEDALRQSTGASFNECRVLQRLGEVGVPLRIGDLAQQLQLSAVTVARSADRLVARGWAQRLASPSDRKAVYVAATDSGRHIQDVIAATVDRLGREYLWVNLNDEQRWAVSQVGHVVIARLRAYEEAERKAALGLLQPID